MPAKDPLLPVMHIRDSCRRINEYASAAGVEWPSSPLVMDAICRNITIIGEAARRYLKPELIKEMVEKDVPVLLTHCLRIPGEE
jgi:uncharacterized protein with HEPN domain